MPCTRRSTETRSTCGLPTRRSSFGPGPAAESYLAQERILDAARRAGAEAVHPGYGFLAENARFARACEEDGLVWIGPPPEAIEAMGSKIASRELMAAAGVPIVPGTTEAVESADEVVRLGDEYGWPVAIKAAAGGGGKGLKIVRTRDEAERAYESARREGEAYFSDSTVYVEKYVEDPRHVEVQVLADGHGTVLHLGERDCTIQRRHQKLIEESPSPAVTAELRGRIGGIAVEAARAVGYRSAGTVEGLLDRAGNYYFLEMNTRIQVEHTVTEMVTGIDLVREQILIAAGEPISFRQEDVRFAGHAIECRINAEDPSNGFLPSPGTITAYREPAGPGVRVDSGVAAGSEIQALYDPMIAKLIVWDTDRESARRRMLRALDEFVIEGVSTLDRVPQGATRPSVLRRGSDLPRRRRERIDRRARTEADDVGRTPPWAARGRDGRALERVVLAEVDGRRFEVTLLEPEPLHAELARRRREREAGNASGAGSEAIVSPMQGTVLAVEVADGDEVRAGQVVCVVEAMKMENEIVAHRAGVVGALSVAPGKPVKTGQVVCVVVAEGDDPAS